MNWYKTSQSLELGPGLGLQRSTPDDNFASALVQSQEIIEEMKLEEVLEKISKSKGYESILDYVLCALYPEYEQPCRDYYAGKGKKFIENIPKNKIKEIDDIAGKALLVFYMKHKAMQKEKT